MRAQLLALAEHRTRLVARAQEERAAINALLAPADAAAALGSSLTQLARRARDEAGRYPLVVFAGVALLAALRPKRAATWIARGWSLWRLYRGARGWWLRFAESGTDASVRRTDASVRRTDASVRGETPKAAP